MVQNVYSWDIIHRYFPPEQIEKYRQHIINDWKSGLFKNEEIWEKYGMSENTFYDLLKRYSKENEEGLKDKSKKPKNPFRKLEEEDVKLIIGKVQNEQERIKTSQSEFERDMIKDGGSLSKSKLDELKPMFSRISLQINILQK
jgi:transposase